MGFRIVGAVNTNEVRGTKLVKVREFQVMSLPSETYFEFRRTPDQPGFADPKPAAKQLSDRIEAVLGLDNVTDVVWSQEPRPGGALLDWMTTFYRTPDGTVSGSVESDLAHFGPSFTGKQVAAEIAAGGDLLGA